MGSGNVSLYTIPDEGIGGGGRYNPEAVEGTVDCRSEKGFCLS